MSSEEIQSRTMPTQKEMSLAATVKLGVGPRGDGDIPLELKEQLDATEFSIQLGMTGRYHLHRWIWKNEDFQIFWDRRNNAETGEQWSFLNHRKKKEALARRQHEIEEFYGDFTPLDPDVHGNFKT